VGEQIADCYLLAEIISARGKGTPGEYQREGHKVVRESAM